MSTVYRARAPLRLSFSGGGTDVSPYPEERGGAVLSATIDKFCYATLKPRRDRALRVRLLDSAVVRAGSNRRGDVDLVRAAVRACRPPGGAEVGVHSDAPPGSGLGASSTLVVAVVAVVRKWLGQPLRGHEIAELSYRIEREDVGIAGGRQDQYAAAFGSFNFIEFQRDVTLVQPLAVPDEVRLELEYRLLLCYLGRTRTSNRIIERQTAAYRSGQKRVLGALDGLKALTFAMRRELLRGRIDEFGDLLHAAWLCKRSLDERISWPALDELYEQARHAGAIGGKMPGAGGGGFFFFLCRPERKQRVAAVLRRWGAQLVPASFYPNGVTAWRSTR